MSKSIHYFFLILTSDNQPMQIYFLIYVSYSMIVQCSWQMVNLFLAKFIISQCARIVAFTYHNFHKLGIMKTDA